MKIAFDAGHPFSWADGGIRVLSSRLIQELNLLNIDVDPIRWWDKDQKIDLLQTFYFPNNITRYSLSKGVKTVAYVCLDGLTSRSFLFSLAGRIEINLYKKLRPSIADKLGYRMSEIGSEFIVPTFGEIEYLNKLFGIERNRSHAIMHGVDQIYLEKKWAGKEDYLVSVGTICTRKNSLLLAKSANALKVPIYFIGRLQDTNLEYLNLFTKEVNNKYVYLFDNCSDERKIELLVRSRAHITLSKGESGGISNLEAIALGVPIILPSYDWATLAYRDQAQYIQMNTFRSILKTLKFGIDHAKPADNFEVLSWKQVALKYLKVYEHTLSKSRN